MLGREITASSVLVFVGCELDVRKRPSDLTVVSSRRLPRWLKKQREGVLTPSEVTQIAAVACLPQTWHAPTRRHKPASAPNATTPKALEPKASESKALERTEHDVASSSATAPSVDEGWTTHRWRRFGHDRLYLNDADGRTLGHLDLKTNTVQVDDGVRADAVHEALLDARPKD